MKHYLLLLNVYMFVGLMKTREQNNTWEKTKPVTVYFGGSPLPHKV